MYTTVMIIFILTYLLISATSRVNKALAVLIAACVIVFLKVEPFPDMVGRIDLNVIFMLMGIMIIGDILAQTGLFEWIAIMVARKTGGNGLLTVMGLLVATALCSAFFNNIIALILFIPVIILLAQILNLPVRPLLILAALFANLGGTATLIGDPCNMIVGLRAGLTFVQFIWHLTPVVLAIGVVWLLMVAVFKGRTFAAGVGSRQQIMKALPEKAIADYTMLRRVLLMCGFILVCLVGGSFYSGSVPGVIILFGAIMTGLICKMRMGHVLQKVDWPSIIFVGGLYVIIGSLEQQKGFDSLVKVMSEYAGGDPFHMALLILWGAALFSSLVDNIPMAIALAPLVERISPSLSVYEKNHPLLWALILGITLGGSISLFGSSTNFAVKRLADRNKYHIGVGSFTAYGMPFALVGLLISSLYLYLRYFMSMK